MNYFLSGFKNYAKFSGRLERAGYWYFVLESIPIGYLLFFVEEIIEAIAKLLNLNKVVGVDYFESDYGLILFGLYMLFISVPIISAAVRRLHDVGKSGWNLLIIFIPLFGYFWILILLLCESEPRENKYGQYSKNVYFGQTKGPRTN